MTISGIKQKVNFNEELVTPEQQWFYSSKIELLELKANSEIPSSTYVCVINIKVNSGLIGVFLESKNTHKMLCTEIILDKGKHCIQLQCNDINEVNLIIRNASDQGFSTYILNCLDLLPSYELDISDKIDRLLPNILRSTNNTDLELIAAEYKVNIYQIRSLKCHSNTICTLDLKDIFSDEVGTILLQYFKRMTSLIPEIKTNSLDKNQGFGDHNYWQSYCKQNLIRVYHLITSFREQGFYSGSILEVGSFFGTFAIPLQKLGYQVTVMDRFENFGDAIDVYIDEMRALGINLISSTKENEYELLDSLPEFDAVISMAVIEHVPHTPRYFLQALKSKIKNNGIIALDTPNIARYWNRKYLSQGKTIHQAIDKQFYSKIPYEGHHREYTKQEMVWMLNQLNIVDIKTKLFEYNLLQFNEISGEHLDALLAMICDTDQKDTILITGKVENNSST
jgi:2-polyprenyl-3-methyl-5-hydroxy-6-metoxy-1,4-benzoquinol methylase